MYIICNVIIAVTFADDKWTLRTKIDGAEYNVSSKFYLSGIATMPYPSNHILIWGSVLFHRYRLIISGSIVSSNTALCLYQINE